MDDYRPYFTYWVTIVQVLITIVSIICYGFGPLGFTIVQQQEVVSFLYSSSSFPGTQIQKEN
jgi:hypothetical protein